MWFRAYLAGNGRKEKTPEIEKHVFILKVLFSCHSIYHYSSVENWVRRIPGYRPKNYKTIQTIDQMSKLLRETQ